MGATVTLPLGSRTYCMYCIVDALWWFCVCGGFVGGGGWGLVDVSVHIFLMNSNSIAHRNTYAH